MVSRDTPAGSPITLEHAPVEQSFSAKQIVTPSKSLNDIWVRIPAPAGIVPPDKLKPSTDVEEVLAINPSGALAPVIFIPKSSN